MNASNPPTPHTVDGRNSAPPEKLRDDASPVNTNNKGLLGFQCGAGFRPPTVGQTVIFGGSISWLPGVAGLPIEKLQCSGAVH